MTDVCGAFTGGIMTIGLKFGRSEADDTAARAMSGKMVGKFAKQFKENTSGKLTCKDILGCDMRTAEGKAKMKEEGLRKKVCTKLVRTAAEILEEMVI